MILESLINSVGLVFVYILLWQKQEHLFNVRTKWI